MSAHANPPGGKPAAINRRSVALVAFVALAVLCAVILSVGWGRLALRRTHQTLLRHGVQAVPAALSHFRPAPRFGDRFGDGTPDFLRLTDPADVAAFRRWFTLIAEYQAARPPAEVPPEIADCASLLRYSYREALKRHDESWLMASGIDVQAPPGEIRAWNYPHTPLGPALFRVRPGAFEPGDLSNGAFAQFADAKTLVERNAFFVSRDVGRALPGDLLFYRQFGQSSPWHSMIVIRAGIDAEVVYDTGPDYGDSPHRRGPVRRAVGQPGKLRRILLSDLLDHPQPQWRPLAGNPNFLGVYRWNILRGTP